MRKFFIVLILGFLMVNLTGCHALRKKFVRKNKKETPPPLYLELREYPKAPTKEMYHEYYLFVRGWLEELKRAIEENQSPKRQKKSIDEAIKNLEQVMYYYNERGKEKIAPLHQRFLQLREEIYDPYFTATGNFNYVLREIDRLKREFEKNYSYEDASKWIKTEVNKE